MRSSLSLFSLALLAIFAQAAPIAENKIDVAARGDGNGNPKLVANGNGNGNPSRLVKR
jgi:hypothetical protein